MSACDRPLSDATLLEWWTGELAPAEQREAERHLLSCPQCSGRASTMRQLVVGLVREGAVATVVLPPVVDRLRREGRRIREYRVAAGAGVQCTVGPDDDVVLTRLVAALSGVTRLDVEIQVGDLPPQRLGDVPFEPAGGELLISFLTEELRAIPAQVQKLRLLAIEPVGERVLGEYTFNHTPWPGR
jgi:hypothetical protein